jgi:hypothetical protein
VGSGARAAAACGDDVGRDERTCKRAVGAIAPSWSRQPTSDTALLRADLDRLRCSAVALGAVAAVAISPAKLETGLGLAGLHGGTRTEICSPGAGQGPRSCSFAC